MYTQRDRRPQQNRRSPEYSFNVKLFPILGKSWFTANNNNNNNNILDFDKAPNAVAGRPAQIDLVAPLQLFGCPPSSENNKNKLTEIYRGNNISRVYRSFVAIAKSAHSLARCGSCGRWVEPKGCRVTAVGRLWAHTLTYISRRTEHIIIYI